MRRVLKGHEVSSPPSPWRPPEAPADAVHDQAGGAADDVPVVDLRGAEQEARQEGLARGICTAEESYRAKLARLEALTASLQAEREQFFQRIEPELVRLTIAIAEKVIAREIESRPETVVDIVRAAMKRLRDRESLRVSVNPRDLEYVRQARDDLLSAVDGVRKLDIVEDRRVEPGGTLIESPNGTLDARLRTQLEEVAAAVGAALPTSEEGDDPGPQPLPPSDPED